MAQRKRDDEPTDKASWVWLMVQLASVDREMYRLMRERGWITAAQYQLLDGKSDKAN